MGSDEWEWEIRITGAKSPSDASIYDQSVALYISLGRTSGVGRGSKKRGNNNHR